MVGEMASLLSHELNQPLAAISSYATGSLNLLDDEVADRDAQESSLKEQPAMAGVSPHLASDLQGAFKRIAEQAERAGRVIKSVHDFVRRRDQAREAVAPMALLDAVMPLVSLQARKLSVRVVVDVNPACPEVLCDRTMVEQVLLNLARNGMQAMQNLESVQSASINPKNQKADPLEKLLQLHVRPAASTPHSRWIEFAVTDFGEGIAEEIAEQLFTPFFTTKREGMGLGLSLCRTVVEQHGGVLCFESVQPRGTVFKFTLPAAGNSAPAND
jgi:two-component system sensor histidine kinase DctS